MLAPAEREQVAIHVEACALCTALLAAARRAQTPAELRQAAARAAFFARCDEALAPGPLAVPVPRRARTARPLRAAVAAVLALVTLWVGPEGQPIRVLRGAPVPYAADVASPLPSPALAAAASAELAARGRAQWVRGVELARLGDLAGGLVAYRQALTVYEQLGDEDTVAWLHFLIGEAYGYLGIAGEGWRHRQLALAVLPQLSNRERATSALVSSAMLSLLEDRPATAAALLDEAVAAAVSGTPYQLAHAHLWRSRARLALHDDAGAREDLHLATTWAARALPSDRRELSGDLELAQGLLAGDPREAIDALSRAAAAFEVTARGFWIPVVLLERSRAYVRAGDVDAADEDLRQGIELLAQQDGRTAVDAWASRLVGGDRLVDARVQLALARGRGAEAYAIAEEGRAPALRAGDALSAASIRARLEPGVTLLTYAVLSDRVVLWRTSQRGVTQIPLAIAPGELRQLTSSFTTDLASDSWKTETQRIARRLHAALLAPAGVVAGALVIVPDEELHALPFAALVDERGRFLIEEHELTLAPSASVYLQARDRWRALSATAPRDALVVGDPLHRSLMQLPALPGARDEARRVAALYPEPELLIGAAATRQAVLAGVGHSVVHIAAHAFANRLLPERSSLALAGGDGAVLYAAEVAALRLPATRTVVLSACATATGPSLAGEGPASLARAFLATGTPAVVASLWPVDDAAATPLLTALHRGLRAGERPAAALRAAQMQMLAAGDPAQRRPSAWATFAALGG
jgi:CHAT domain-containing protein